MRSREAAPLHTQLPWMGLATDRVILTKGGGLLSAARLHGACFEGRSPADVDYPALRWTSALKSLDPGWRILWLTRKRRLQELDQRDPGDVLGQQAREARHRHLLSKGLYTIESAVYWFWNPGFSPAPRNGQHAGVLHDWSRRLVLWLSPGRTRRVLEEDVLRACERFEGAVDAFCGLVRDVTPLERLAGGSLFRDLALTANSRWAARNGEFLGAHALDRQLALSDMEVHRDHLMLDAERVETHVLIDPPTAARAHLFGGVLDLDAELDLCAAWLREDGSRSRRRIRNARRHYHQKRYTMLAHASSGDSSPQARGALADRAAEAEADQLGEAMRELEVEGLPFGDHSLTVTLRGESAAAIESVRPQLLRVAAAADGRFHRETYNGLNAWFAALPGNHARQLRTNYLSAAVATDLAPLWSVSEGNRRDGHLDDEYLAILETRRRTPYYYSAHAGDIAHTLVVGSTGSGKSFLLNFLLAQARKYRPRVCILDLGGSYRHLTELVGGAYLELRPDEGHMPCRLNPFRALDPSADNLQFLESFVRMLLETEGKRCDAHERAELRSQISALYEVEPRARTLSSLSELLPARLRQPLSAWTGGGVRGPVFDNEEDTLTLADWQALDLAGAADQPELARALVYYLLYRLGAAIADPDQLSRWKLLVVDEAWRFLADASIGACLAEGLKTWRKCNAGVVLATQSPSDLTGNESLRRTVSESCLTKIFLANPEGDAADYVSAFGLPPSEADAVRTLLPKRQLLLHRSGEAHILELTVDPRSYWLYTTNPVEAARRREAIRSHGLERGLDQLLENSINASE